MPNDIVAEFIQQLPAGLVALFCLPGVLLILAIGVSVYLRRRRAQKQALAQGDQSSSAATPPPIELYPDASDLETLPEPSSPAAAARRYADDDLPDLDMLVDTSELRRTAPVIVPAAPSIPLRSAPEGVYSVKLHNGGKTQAKEMLAILRDERDGRLMIQLDGSTYRTLAELPEVKKNFARIMKKLSEDITAPDDLPAEEIAEEIEEIEAIETPAIPESQMPPSTPVKTIPPPPQPDGSMPGDLPSFKLDDNAPVIKRKGLFGRKTEIQIEPVADLDIGGAVESYLQHKLRHTPEYSGRKFHIRNTIGGGLQIQVDDRFYEAVDEIEDADVRAFISETIREWHERQ